MTVLLCTVILSSCEVEYNFKEKDLNPRVTVNALITPQEPFAVCLHWSRNYSATNTFSPVTEAEIRLYENNIEVVRCPADPKGITETTFQAAAGRSYRLMVTVPGYGELSAQTTVPEAPTGSLSFVRQKGWYRHFDMNELSVSDNITAIWIRGNSKYNDQIEKIAEYYTTSAFVDQVNGANDSFEADDKGSTIDYEQFLRIPYEYCREVVPLRFSVFGSPKDTDYFRIIAASSTYDRYMRSRYKQELNSEWNAQENPFIEQITVYSNIDNGLGIFAGYNYYTTPEL